MGWIRDFGSRNHPETKERKARVQKARAGMSVTEETVAAYTAARGFLMGAWFGASMSCASIGMLYMLTVPTFGVSGPVAFAVSLAFFVVGGYVYWTNHTYYRRLDFPWAKRWDTGALVVAGAGAVFWLLFALLATLAWMGIRVLPE